MSNPPPEVSVVIPTYNRARFLKAAIESVLDQTFRDLELIVVDDGSTDDTAAVLAAMVDPRCRIVRRAHQGISAALNAGLEVARGEFFARLDSDDLWLPDLLATLLPPLQEDHRLGFAYGRARAMSSDGTLREHLQGNPPRYPHDGLRSLLFDDCTCNIALVARRASIDRAGRFDEELFAHEDWDMWLRVGQVDPFLFVDRELARIRWHDGNLTGMSSPHLPAVLETRRAPLDKFFAQRDLRPEVRRMAAAAYTNVEVYVGQRWLQAGESRRALASFQRALRAGGNPLLTAARIVWLAGFVPVLRRSAAGRRLVEGFAQLRRRARSRRTASMA